jgi:hypothetical protein
MPIAKLQDLRAQVEAAISEKLQSRRHELEAELSKLDGYSGGGRRGRPAGRGGPSRLRKKVLGGCRYATLIQIRGRWRTKDTIERTFGF